MAFAVIPKTNCPHLQDHLSSIPDFKINVLNPCKLCQNEEENWICLKCFEIHCSRYIKKHAKFHYKETNHSIALSFSDLSIWCYQCKSYLKHQVCFV